MPQHGVLGHKVFVKYSPLSGTLNWLFLFAITVSDQCCNYFSSPPFFLLIIYVFIYKINKSFDINLHYFLSAHWE